MNDYLLFKHACLAAMGGLVRVLVNDEKYTALRFFAGAFVGIFCGMLVFFGCKHFAAGEYMTAVFVGLGGYIGTPLLDIMGKKFKQILRNK